MNQLDLFAWADSKPSNVIDIMPALIKKVAREPWPPQPKAGDLIQLKRGAA